MQDWCSGILQKWRGLDGESYITFVVILQKWRGLDGESYITFVIYKDKNRASSVVTSETRLSRRKDRRNSMANSSWCRTDRYFIIATTSHLNYHFDMPHSGYLAFSSDGLKFPQLQILSVGSISFLLIWAMSLC